MRSKRYLMLIIAILLIILTGCKPYFMLDEKGKVQRIITKYVNLINKGDFEESFKLLTFIHIPKQRKFEMYKLAQTLLTNSYQKIEYDVKKIDIKNNICSLELNMIFSSEIPVPRKIKVESQLFMYRPENSSIWFIVSGNEDSRNVFYNNFAKEKGFKYIPDKTFVSYKGKYYPQEEIKMEKGQVFLLEKGKWVEQK